MTVALTASEYLAYSNAERAKWREWFAAHPEALCAVVQREVESTDAGTLLYHAFTAEGWHTQSLWGETPDLPGIPVTNGAALFAYGERMRSRFEEFLKTTQQDPGVPREFAGHGRTFRMSHRKTVFMLLIHETRHLAQIATAVRNAGFDPPGQHDFFFSAAME